MGHKLYKTEPVFHSALRECISLLEAEVADVFLKILFSETDNPTLLNQTRYTQPMLFSLEYALTKLWNSWGIVPDVLLGHSVGEYVAACVADVFSLADGLKLINARGQLMDKLCEPGEMLAVISSYSEVEHLLIGCKGRVSIAAVNGPQQVVVSGEASALSEIAKRCAAKDIKVHRLSVSHGFHSPLMKPMISAFTAVAEEIAYKPPQMTIISNVTGQPIDKGIATPKYWLDHVLKCVRFAQGMESLSTLGCEIFVEVGPHPTLLAMGKDRARNNFPFLRHRIYHVIPITKDFVKLYICILIEIRSCFFPSSIYFFTDA